MKKIGFALEYGLGHVTHAQNLKRFLADSGDVDPVYIDIPFDSTPMPALLKPVFKDNWSVRASAAARRGLMPHVASLDACFFHTQITSLFSNSIMRRVPSIVSLDATPMQYDSLGSFYKHKPGPAALESIKKRMNERAFQNAAHLVTWSQWAKDSLVKDYGVLDQKVTVIPPGIDLDRWKVPRGDERRKSVTFLFVGADFERKGGPVLLEAFRKVRLIHADATLIIVTKTLPADFSEANIEVHRNITPNSDDLRKLYARADVFAFPTLGDCLPLAVMEAMAAGLPVITSDVGALSEAVINGVNGLVVPTSNSTALSDAMQSLIESPDSQFRMSEQSLIRGTANFDASKNYLKLISLLKNLQFMPGS